MADISLIEERKASMISSTSGKPYERIATFLKPTAETHEEAVAVPFRHLLTEPISPKLSKSTHKITFKGWRRPQRKWKQWVNLMLPRYAPTWKKSGIFDSIKASTCEIRRDPATILGLVESWCEETNTFVFQWGEATITLQDVLILGGFSVLGVSVNAPPKEEMREIEKRLVEEKRGFYRQKSKKATHAAWMNYYMGVDGEVEHVAFLSLWVSRYVFPAQPFDTIGQYVFYIAARLAEGTRIALGPAVLASLYRDLGLMKRNMDNGAPASVVWAPFRLLQTWAWERFPSLRPKSQPNKLSFVRKVSKSKNDFQWRPYKETSLYVDDVEDGELGSLARLVRASELVGLHCSELYRPHRVAMQFGFDQDLPGLVSLKNCERMDEEIIINVADRVFESEVSFRYLEWWKRTILDKRAAIEGIVKQLMSTEEGDEKDESDAVRSVPPGFSPMDKKRNWQESWDDDDLTLSERLKLKKHGIRPSGLVAVKNKEGERASLMTQHKRKELRSRERKMKKSLISQ
ncbi:hypothetical protein MRB53_031295 [Persea americana]|uniref:Uncharacterized protein n=1 Tax=Persea americana TaxID=3435 RepID=A0ACC2KNK5_PERAE|nr:hypothetical protein MRB53_031295 [Persea americana]